MTKNKLQQLKTSVKNHAPEITIAVGAALISVAYFYAKNGSANAELEAFKDQALLVLSGPTYDHLLETGGSYLYETAYGDVLVKAVPKN